MTSTTRTTATEKLPSNAGRDDRLSGPARRLLDAANDLFYERGAVATSVREITAACGVTPGALYNHFSSKEELLFVLVRAKHLMIEREVIAAQAAAPGDPVSQLSAIVRVYVRVHVAHSSGARVSNREYVHLTGSRLAEIVAIRRRLRDRVVRVVTSGATEGVFDICGGTDQNSTRLVASTILDMCIHAGSWLRVDGPLGLPELEARFVSMALRLAGAKRG
jgi:TetR/AcrR family transcriptional regulator, cholesterol catabolism regulator